MKQLILSMMLALLGLPIFSVVSADTLTDSSVGVNAVLPSLPTVSLDQVKLMIRQKETFFLYIGRQDVWNGSETYQKVAQAAAASGQRVYYLDTTGIASKPYKAFMVKYRIKSPTYLAQFGNKQQLKQLSLLDHISEEAFLSFFQTVD